MVKWLKMNKKLGLLTLLVLTIGTVHGLRNNDSSTYTCNWNDDVFDLTVTVTSVDGSTINYGIFGDIPPFFWNEELNLESTAWFERWGHYVPFIRPNLNVGDSIVNLEGSPTVTEIIYQKWCDVDRETCYVFLSGDSMTIPLHLYYDRETGVLVNATYSGAGFGWVKVWITETTLWSKPEDISWFNSFVLAMLLVGIMFGLYLAFKRKKK